MPIQGRINAAGEQDAWTFFGHAGQDISVLVNPSGNVAANFLSPFTPVLTWAAVSLIAPDGSTVVASQNATVSGQVLALNSVTLPTDGAYTVKVTSATGHASSTGNYILAAYDVSPHTLSLDLNHSVVGNIAVPFAFDQYSFSAQANTQIQFKLAGGSSAALTYTLAGPNGQVLFNNATASSGLIDLNFSGTYTLTVQGVSGQTGKYGFSIVTTNQTSLALGTSYTGTSSGNGQAQLFAIPVSDSDPVTISLVDPNASDHNELFASFGHPPTRETYDYGITSTGANQSILVPNGKPTTLYVLVYNDTVKSTPGTYTLLVQSTPAVLTSASPGTGAANAPTTLTLTGAGFIAGTLVSLVASNNTIYPATSSTTDLPTQITATFAPGSVPAGTYSIQISQNGTTTTLPNAFTMVASGQAILTTHLELPNPMSRHIAETLYIDYTNIGTVAMPAPILVLTGANPLGQQGALFTLDPSLRGIGLWTSATPAGFTHSIEILADGSTPGVLQPGESERIPVYYAGWLSSQWDFASPQLSFSIQALQADNATAENWPGMQASLQPPGINNTAWNAIFSGLENQLSTTIGGYVQMLDNQASYLSRLGETVNDVSKLWNFAVQQASNSLNPQAQFLVSTVDDGVAVAGQLQLTMTRSYAQNIVARDTPGPFGMGWSTSWQTSASVQSDGTVLILQPGGGERIFQPDSRTPGVYFSLPGDSGTLTPDGAGCYLLTEIDGTKTDYTAAGFLNYRQDSDGNRITVGYTGIKLTSLTASGGQFIDIAYNGGSDLLPHRFYRPHHHLYL